MFQNFALSLFLILAVLSRATTLLQTLGRASMLKLKKKPKNQIKNNCLRCYETLQLKRLNNERRITLFIEIFKN